MLAKPADESASRAGGATVDCHDGLTDGNGMDALVIGLVSRGWPSPELAGNVRPMMVWELDVGPE
jgi:hypothetical protein